MKQAEVVYLTSIKRSCSLQIKFSVHCMIDASKSSCRCNTQYAECRSEKAACAIQNTVSHCFT